ncbi:ester cyclase [Arthrobacter sp. H41]|uniref:ester cyclase n=1 Tax=Arthrobacter sp. H41 TaxID=1312978 RepID=UPI0004B860F9|nr:ester cyclase [Arthrobacter sp. H41]
MPDNPDLRKVYQRIIDVVGANDAAVLEGLIAADLIDHMPVPGQPPGRMGFIFWMHGMHAASPDMTGLISDTVVEGDRVAGRVLWTGTHEGDFLGLPGTGRQIAITAMHLVRFEDGMAAEWWGAADLLGAAMNLNARLEPSP